jgi:hypothetical protein
MSEETKKPEKKDTVEALEARLQELQAELDREKLKNLALNTMIEVAEEELQIDIRKPGAKQRAYYQKLNYNYQEYAEDGIILDLIAEYRKDMGRLGGRNDSFHIGRDRLFDLLDRASEGISPVADELRSPQLRFGRLPAHAERHRAGDTSYSSAQKEFGDGGVPAGEAGGGVLLRRGGLHGGY